VIESRPGFKAVALLVGGTRDGEMVEDIGMPMIVYAGLRSAPVMRMGEFCDPGVIANERYTRRRFKDADGSIDLYVIEGMPLAQALSRLILFYRPKEKR